MSTGAEPATVQTVIKQQITTDFVQFIDHS